MRDSTARKLEDLGLSVRARQRPKILYKHSPDIRRCWTFCCWDCPPSETEAGRIETRLNITNNNNKKKITNSVATVTLSAFRIRIGNTDLNPERNSN
jgi:hypothetical protein